MEQRYDCHIPELQRLSQVQSYLPEIKISKIVLRTAYMPIDWIFYVKIYHQNTIPFFLADFLVSCVYVLLVIRRLSYHAFCHSDD